MATVETQLGVSLNIAPLDDISYPDFPGRLRVDKDTVLADTTYDGFLSYADAYSSQQTKDLIYFIYQDDVDTFSYAQ